MKMETERLEGKGKFNKRKMIKQIIVIILINAIALGFVIPGIYASLTPIKENELVEKVITVEEVIYRRAKSTRFRIVADGEEYMISDVDYSYSELNKMISPGDVIQIRYYTYNWCFSFLQGTTKSIVDARSEDTVYVSLENEKQRQEKSSTTNVIFYSILGFVFLGGSVFYICIAVTDEWVIPKKTASPYPSEEEDPQTKV